MREIKFRAWVPSKKILCDVLTFNFNEKTAQLPIETEVNAAYWWDVTSWSFEDIKLLQYTGRKDKNDVEIYEGDIFKALHDFGPAGMHERISSVAFDLRKGYQWEYWDLDSIEVIGNIYEHPHLLEVSE